MGKHSFYDKDTGEQVFGSGRRQSVKDSYGSPNWIEIEKEASFWKLLGSTIGLVGHKGVASNRCGTYLNGCGLYDTHIQGYALIEEEKIRGRRYKASLTSEVYESIDKLLDALSVQTLLVDDTNTLTVFGSDVWAFLEKCEEKEPTWYYLKKLVPHLPNEWWGWTRPEL